MVLYCFVLYSEGIDSTIFLITFADYLSDRWNREAAIDKLKKIANIIAWNFWQMDGLTGR